MQSVTVVARTAKNRQQEYKVKTKHKKNASLFWNNLRRHKTPQVTEVVSLHKAQKQSTSFDERVWLRWVWSAQYHESGGWLSDKI